MSTIAFPAIGSIGASTLSESDPVLDAILRAPLSARVETEEERAAFDTVMASIPAGLFVSPDEIAATIAGMQREAGE